MIRLDIPNEYHIVNMVSIDPGLNTCGIALYRLDTIKKEIVSIEAFTIYVDNLNDDTGLIEDITTERFIKIIKLCNAIKRIIKEVDAKVVVSEAPFYNRFMPMAYGALLEVVSNINRSVYEVNNSIIFDSYAPQLVKMSIGAAGIKGKDVIKDKIRESILHSKILGNYEMLDEHSIDAIAVGYTFLIKRCGYGKWN